MVAQGSQNILNTDGDTTDIFMFGKPIDFPLRVQDVLNRICFVCYRINISSFILIQIIWKPI